MRELGPELKSKYAVRWKKNFARKMYANLMSDMKSNYQKFITEFRVTLELL